MGQSPSSNWNPAARAQALKLANILGPPASYDPQAGGAAVWDLVRCRQATGPVRATASAAPWSQWVRVTVRDRVGQPTAFPWPHFSNVIVHMPFTASAALMACLGRLSSEYDYAPAAGSAPSCLVVGSGDPGMCAVLCRFALSIQRREVTCEAAVSGQLLQKALLGMAPAGVTGKRERFDAQFYRWLGEAEQQGLLRGDLSSPLSVTSSGTVSNGNGSGASASRRERFLADDNPYASNDPAVQVRLEFEDQRFYTDQDRAALATRSSGAPRTEHFASEGTVDPRFTVDTATIFYDVGSDVNEITRTYGTVSQKQRYPTYQDALAGYHSLPPLPPPTQAQADARYNGFHPPAASLAERFIPNDPFAQAVVPSGSSAVATDLFLQRVLPSVNRAGVRERFNPAADDLFANAVVPRGNGALPNDLFVQKIMPGTR